MYWGGEKKQGTHRKYYRITEKGREFYCVIET